MEIKEDQLREFQKKHQSIKQNTQKKPEGEGPKYKWYSPPYNKGEGCVVRILPLSKDKIGEPPGKILYYHTNLPEEDKRLCMETHQRECPHCKVLNDFEARMDVSLWSPVAKSAMQVLVLYEFDKDGNERKPKDRDGNIINPTDPHILMGGDYNLLWVIDQMLNKEIGDITHPYEGTTMIFKRTIDGGKFERSIGRGSSPISDTKEKTEELLENMFNLDKIWRDPDDEFVKHSRANAKLLRETFENRLLTLENESTRSDNTSKESSKEEKEPEKSEEKKEQAAPPTEEKKEVSKPNGAPDCFAKSFTEEENEQGEKCAVCPHELDCKKAMSK